MFDMAFALRAHPMSGPVSLIGINLLELEKCCALPMQYGLVDYFRHLLSDIAKDSMQAHLHTQDYEDADAKVLANQMTDLYARKNRDYGNSFDKSMDKFGLVVAAIRIGDKVNRLRSLIEKGSAEVKDESLADTFIDLACYSIMTLMWLDGKRESESVVE